jgi:hypothetical protein
LNTAKCKVIVAGNKDHKVTVRVGNSLIKEQKSVDLLGLKKIDNKLKFEEHISKSVKKANSKLFVIKRGLGMLNFEKRKVLLNSFVQSQFSYAPLVWMCGKVSNKKIDQVHYNFLKILYNDYASTFEQLLDKYCEFTVHQKNIQKVLIEMYKVNKEQGPSYLMKFSKNQIMKAQL